MSFGSGRAVQNFITEQQFM